MPRITSRERRDEASRRLSELETALQLAEQRFGFLIQHTSDIISIVDADGTVRWISPSVERMLGRQPDSLVGTSYLADVDPDDLPRMRAALASAVNDAGAQPSVEIRIRHADGSWRSLEATLRNLLDDPSISGIVVNARDITARKAFEQQLASKAFYDPLTGLPNRILFMYSIEHGLARSRRGRAGVAVMFLDVDGFKTVNDSLGHSVGDRLLIALGQRLKACVRPGDTVARLGGDEFTVLLEQIAAPEEAERVAQRILGRLESPFLLDGRVFHVSASIGIAFGTTADASPEDLLRFADAAMYRAKSDGKARVAVFDRGMHDHWVARLSLEADLRRALDQGELRLHYQPVFDLASNRISGVEALVRWQHPERGLTLPADFLDLAEETGLIVPLGHWVLETACRQMREWQLQYPDRRPLSVTVNVSAREFRQPDLVAHVSAALESSDLEPSSLHLEVDERVVLDGAPRTSKTIEALTALGVRLSLDDFGTAYASLNNLQRLPVRVLKLDRSLVATLADARTFSVAKAIVEVSHVLGIEVSAEGIETAEELTGLRSLACDRGQGFLLAPPISAETMTAQFASEAPVLIHD